MNKQTKIKPQNSVCTLLFSIITNLLKEENGDFLKSLFTNTGIMIQ
jgi:hypothetical protein